MSSIFSCTCSLFTFRVTEISARLADVDIRKSFLYLPPETVIWSLLDSIQNLHQLRHMVAWLILHEFAVSIYFFKVWDSHLRADAPQSIWHFTTRLLLIVFISIGATHCFFFVSKFAIFATFIFATWSSVSDGSLNMQACTPPSFEPTTILSLISSSSNWTNLQKDANLLSDAK